MPTVEHAGPVAGNPFARALVLTSIAWNVVSPSRAAVGERATFDAKAVMRQSEAQGGRAYIVTPKPGEMVRTNRKPFGAVMMYWPEGPGQELAVTLPVTQAGYYRVKATHVFGAWKHGRYGWYRASADGVALPGKFHGWYGPTGAPKHWPKAKTHLVDVNWGTIYLRQPSVRLVFTPVTDGLLGTERLALVPVPASKVKPEDKGRRVPARRVAAKPATRGPTTSTCKVTEAGDLKWVVPVMPGTITVDGDLGEWDFTKPAIVATMDTIHQQKLGWATPAPQGDTDLSAHVQLAWDADHLYLGAHVTDDQLAETAGRKKWGSPWGHDSVVVRVLPPVWLTSGPRAVGSVAEQFHFGLSYYSSQTGPRPLPSGVHYVARKTAKGYDVEAAIAFGTLGFRARAGDRVPLMLILSDVDPGKSAQRRFDQYGLPTRGFGGRQVAQARLLCAGGWGADVALDRTQVGRGAGVRFLGTVDVVARAVHLRGVAVVALPGGRVVRRVACQQPLLPGHRYRVHGAVAIPAKAEPGTHDLRLNITSQP